MVHKPNSVYSFTLDLGLSGIIHINKRRTGPKHKLPSRLCPVKDQQANSRRLWYSVDRLSVGHLVGIHSRNLAAKGEWWCIYLTIASLSPTPLRIEATFASMREARLPTLLWSNHAISCVNNIRLSSNSSQGRCR